ncbi:pyridoxamine 5'-phosphate oxidase family protein [Limibacillus sp. MBR-115]|jgi:nitroimidazol reductase NimA-like FMN-containing flavoprotein (pyridoxamine 5'-phosphate oxidase superfamily)|uniref:pyridoxamine 5'-phosphate oxidase family protein n=1 Tax=Limibacillus sp. MBR-115 TaxID=3156465 RepID=UPI003395C1C9
MNTDKRTQVRSHPERASYDKDTYHRIVDDAIFGHLSIVRDAWPHVVPMMVVRIDDEVLVHCRTETELAADLRSGRSAALAITNIRGIVFAKSVRFHSMNYDSLVVHGAPRLVCNLDEKRDMFVSLLNKIWPGRASVVRQPSEPELRSVDVFAFDFSNCAAKVRQGGPVQEYDKNVGDTLSNEIWAGWADLELSVTRFHHTPYGDRDASESQKPKLPEDGTETRTLWKERS